MDPISLSRLAEIIDGTIDGSAIGGVSFRHVTVHSDHVQARSVFFALRGTRSDGHNYVRQALENGAVAAVVARDQADRLRGETDRLIVVEDPLYALHDLAGWWRSSLNATVFAVVGSNGKTVTKDALAYLAAARYLTYGSPRSYNSQLGVALSILECPGDREVVVIEAAATEPSEMSRLREIIRPDHVLITNLGTRHRVNFGSIQRHAEELLEMARELPPAGVVIMGTPHPELTSATVAVARRPHLEAGKSARYPRFAPPQPIDSRLRSLVYSGEDEVADVIVKTPSEEVFADIVLAATAASMLGIEDTELLDCLGVYSPTSTRMEVWKNSSGATIVRDIAMADGLAFDSALRTARRLTNHSGRTILVLAEQFTDDHVRVAGELGQVIAGNNIDTVFGYDVPTHRAVGEILRSASPGTKLFLAQDSVELRQRLSAHIRYEDLVFIQSPRDSSLAEVTLSLVEPISPTRLHVDLSAIEANIGAFRRLIGPSRRLMGVVKADAYGTSSIRIATVLEDCGADFLGVATTNEGIALRDSGIRLPILVFLGSDGDVERMSRYTLTPLVYSEAMLDTVIREARRLNRKIEVHLEVDSGMHRTGLDLEQAVSALQRVKNEPLVVLSGLMTHLGCADMPDEDDLTRQQLALFQKAISETEGLGFENVTVHAAATAGAIRFPEARYDMVRVGIGLYGLHPTDATKEECQLTPGVSLISQIVGVSSIQTGERVGYGGVFKVEGSPRRLAVVPAGYFDAVPRAFGRYGSVVVNGYVCPVVGNVSMDSMTIDISGCPSADVGSDVLIYGQHSGATVPIEDVATAMGIISHELLVRPGPRVQRVFTRH